MATWACRRWVDGDHGRDARATVSSALLGCLVVAPSALEAEIEDEDEFEDEDDFGWDRGYVDERPPFWLSTRPESLNVGRRESAVRIRGKALG